MKRMTRIKTSPFALENVYRRCGLYKLKTHVRGGVERTVPPLVYNPYEHVIWSEGKKFDVQITDRPGNAHPLVVIAGSGAGAWPPASGAATGETNAARRAQIQETRARALIRYAIGSASPNGQATDGFAPTPKASQVPCGQM